MQQLAQPPPTVRMQNGEVFPAATIGQVRQKTKKFLICLSHYDGDVTAAEETASLIADLERTRNHEADFLLMRRADSRELSTQVRQKLEAKFDKLHLHRCRRTDAKGHPWAPNSMFYDLVALMASQPFATDYFAFINLETDCVPTRPGWIGEIIEAWKKATMDGASVMGQFQYSPSPHVNGVAVYAADIARRAGPRGLTGGSAEIPFDIKSGPLLMPMASETPLIFFKWRQSSVTPDDVFRARANGYMPAIYHGVKDESARIAVRERHITLNSAPSAKRPNVYTYFPKTNLLGNTENQSVLDHWRQAWLSRGWNPVILNQSDAMNNAGYAEFVEAVKKLPCSHGDRAKRDDNFFRWLALDTAGGGVLVDFDAIPEGFTPESLGDQKPKMFRTSPAHSIYGGSLTPQESYLWVEQILKYDPQPEDLHDGKPHVSDDTIARHVFPDALISPAIIQFSDTVVGTKRKSEMIAEFLRG